VSVSGVLLTHNVTLDAGAGPSLARVLFWVLLFVGLGVLGLGVLAALTVRLWRQVRQLGREVAAASDRLATASDDLARATPNR